MTNSSLAYPSELTLTMITVIQAWAWLLSTVGTSGNVITIAAILQQFYFERARIKGGFRNNQEPPPHISIKITSDIILLLHLSICDLLYCAVNIPLTAVNYQYAFFSNLTDAPPMKNGDSFCLWIAGFRYLNAFVEWTTLSLLTLQRCVHLKRILPVKMFTPRGTVILICCCWIGGIVGQVGAVLNAKRSPPQAKPSGMEVNSLGPFSPASVPRMCHTPRHLQFVLDCEWGRECAC
ncbi:hypothetical protein SK128_024267 [Halocaridina rubra]|uniref:G-protein coupled receptors family 1 profile domain-containing protein n=1 Tax=Halocaridina rubra TaxID=373956 RepID=A0AAN8XKW2_HALRR